MDIGDLDETRRLLYVARYASQTERYNLVGTLVNALAHHGAGIDPEVSGPKLVELVTGADDGWAQDQIDNLTEMIARRRPPPPYE